MMYFNRKDFPVPAGPVKKKDTPAFAISSICCCSSLKFTFGSSGFSTFTVSIFEVVNTDLKPDSFSFVLEKSEILVDATPWNSNCLNSGSLGVKL